MERVAAKFRPQWEGVLEGWTVTFVRRQLWRVLPEHTFEDLMQDGYVNFLRVQELYPEIVDPPHFTAMYKTIMFNHVHRLAEKRTKRKEVSCIVTDENGETQDITTLAESRDITVREREMDMLLEDAPPLIALAIRKLMVEERPVYLRDASGRRETTKQYLARLTKTDPRQVDVESEIYSWVYGERQTVR